jgi:hypothetical protein
MNIRRLVLLVLGVVLLMGDPLSAATLSPSIAGHLSAWQVLTIGALGVTLATGALTLIDWAKRLDPDGKIPAIVELLSQSNEVLDDMLFREGNLPTGERTTIRTGLPTVYWRMLNQGIPPSKSTTAQVDENAGMLEAWSEVDKDLAILNGNIGAFRLSEAGAFLEAMNQEMVQTLFYGNSGIAAEEFTGLAPRYSVISGAANADNIVDAGGTGSDNTSIWLVAWGDQTVTGIFPKGSQAGLIHEDYGEVTVEVTAGIAGNRMRAFQERYQWKNGLVVKDWRYVVRIANIDVSDLATVTPPDLISFMEAADEILPNNLGRRVFYANRRVTRYLRKFVRTAVSNGGGLTFENFAGKRAMTFDGIPIRRVDQILTTEARVI